MRVGIIGTGTMGGVHAAAWQSAGAELAGCFSSNPAQAEEFAKRYQTQAFASYSELLNSADIIDVCTPTTLHKPMVLAAAKAGKHVVCEKPIALTIEDAQAMIDACRGVRFFVGMVLRFFHNIGRLKSLWWRGGLVSLLFCDSSGLVTYRKSRQTTGTSTKQSPAEWS